jgi:hypothetical protein
MTTAAPSRAVNLKVLRKQYDFITATEPEVMYSGAVRAGKTKALCLKTAARASKPRAREILCRKTLSALKGTTLKTLLEGDGNEPPVLPPGTYTHNRAEKVIRIHGGGEIIYFALVNDGKSGVQQRAGSYSGTGVNIDEATELDEGDYRMLLYRASIDIKGLVKQVNMACNPGTPSHFLAERFAPPGSGFSRPMAGCRCIPTKTTDNTFLSPDYIANQNREPGTLWYRRFILGLWCGAEGLVYDKWDRKLHVCERPLSEFRSFVVGVDDGFTNPFVALLIGVDGDGRAHVFSEAYQPGLDVGSRCRAVSKWEGTSTPVDAVLIDPSAPDVISAMQQAGLPAIAANNDVLPGINAVTTRLLTSGDGRPRLTVDPSCENLIREFETYQWKAGKAKDEPVKKHDHAMDALRYSIMHIDGGPVMFAAWAGPQLTRVDTQVTMPTFGASAILDDDEGWEVWGDAATH